MIQRQCLVIVFLLSYSLKLSSYPKPSEMRQLNLSDETSADYKKVESLEHIVVHLTDILPQDKIEVGVRTLKTTLPEGMTPPPIRATVHWRLDGPADPTAVVGEDMTKRRYGVILPLDSVSNQIYGGYARDLYTVGDIILDETATLVVPRSERGRIRPSFSGHVITYDKESMNVVERINNFIKGESSYHYLTEEAIFEVPDFLNFINKFYRGYEDDMQRIFDKYTASLSFCSSKVTNIQKILDETFKGQVSPNAFKVFDDCSYISGGDIYVSVGVTIGPFYPFRQVRYNKIVMNEKDFIDKILDLEDRPEMMRAHSTSIFSLIEQSFMPLMSSDPEDRNNQELCKNIGAASETVGKQSEEILKEKFNKWVAKVIQWLSSNSLDSCPIE